MIRILALALLLAGCASPPMVQTCQLSVDRQGDVSSDCGKWERMK